MQIALVISILAGILIGLVLMHYGTVNLLRATALHLLRAAKWCEDQRAAASASIHERLETQMELLDAPAPDVPRRTSSVGDPVDALRVILRVVETVPGEMIEKALAIEGNVRAAESSSHDGDEPALLEHAAIPRRNGIHRNGRTLS